MLERRRPLAYRRRLLALLALAFSLDRQKLLALDRRLLALTLDRRKPLAYVMRRLLAIVQRKRQCWTRQEEAVDMQQHRHKEVWVAELVEELDNAVFEC